MRLLLRGLCDNAPTKGTLRRCYGSKNINLLKQVCTAERGTMKLLPPEYNITKLRSDYEHMQNMLFGEKPIFDEILNGLTELETEINRGINYKNKV